MGGTTYHTTCIDLIENLILNNRLRATTGLASQKSHLLPNDEVGYEKLTP